MKSNLTVTVTGQNQEELASLLLTSRRNKVPTYLRRIEPEDVDALYAIRNDWDVARHLVGLSPGYAKQDLREWIEVHRGKTSNTVLWAIADEDTDRCIGHIGLYEIDYRSGNADIGLLLGRAQWGRGIGRAAILEALSFAFMQSRLHRVGLRVKTSNVRALALYQRIGFVREGILREAQFRDGAFEDIVLMAMLQSEWEVASAGSI